MVHVSFHIGISSTDLATRLPTQQGRLPESTALHWPRVCPWDGSSVSLHIQSPQRCTGPVSVRGMGRQSASTFTFRFFIHQVLQQGKLSRKR